VQGWRQRVSAGQLRLQLVQAERAFLHRLLGPQVRRLFSDVRRRLVDRQLLRLPRCVQTQEGIGGQLLGHLRLRRQLRRNQRAFLHRVPDLPGRPVQEELRLYRSRRRMRRIFLRRQQLLKIPERLQRLGRPHRHRRVPLAQGVLQLQQDLQTQGRRVPLLLQRDLRMQDEVRWTRHYYLRMIIINLHGFFIRKSQKVENNLVSWGRSNSPKK